MFRSRDRDQWVRGIDSCVRITFEDVNVWFLKLLDLLVQTQRVYK